MPINKSLCLSCQNLTSHGIIRVTNKQGEINHKHNSHCASLNIRLFNIQPFKQCNSFKPIIHINN